MSQELWTAVDRYITQCLLPSDPVLEEVLKTNAAAGLPAWDVAPNQGKLLYLLARMRGAQRILEIGTLGGYSTIWLARALPPEGKLVTLESDPRYAQLAAANIKRAGLAMIVEIRLGTAVESLAQMQAEGAAPFDLIFLDADKANNPAYLEWSMRFSRSRTVIISDNVVRDGAVINPASTDPHIQGVRRFFEMIAADSRIEATAIQTVGSKGHDGFSLAVVK
jgi:predicted O-methyltransferase YrrM